MSNPTEKSDADIFPDAELNPLLNPVLATNMGRWAEVYFTSPPEKRAQAVSDLVRELKSKISTESSSVEPSGEQGPETPEAKLEGRNASAREIRRVWPAMEGMRRTCPACSADNPASQRFCGMCGACLQPVPKANEPTLPDDPAVSAESADRGNGNWNEAAPSVAEYSYEYRGADTQNYSGYARGELSEPEWRIAEADLPHFARESESVPYRLRLYIGIAVALILAALVYMKWHGTAGFSGDASPSAPSRVIPDALPPSPSPQEPANARNVLPTERTTATAPPTPSVTTAAHPVERQNQMETPARPAEPTTARAASPPATTAAATSSVAGGGQSGTEELTMAEKYLNRDHRGAGGDNREAAQWLWKAVGKGNVTATLVLSDLYLRGDGIPKSCDQARLLLDVAARKGQSSAATRLRNLQAFGCQ